MSCHRQASGLPGIPGSFTPLEPLRTLVVCPWPSLLITAVGKSEGVPSRECLRGCWGWSLLQPPSTFRPHPNQGHCLWLLSCRPLWRMCTYFMLDTYHLPLNTSSCLTLTK
uniref:Uncharacterized protein n=1 Tax=Canis lupus dingo TaxID=286419 RepID=A0A8C0JN03_CANLU